MTLILVAVSGTVGKQVVTSGKQVELNRFFLTPSGANATIKIRDGNFPTSSEIVFFGRAPSAFGTKAFECTHKFRKGMHVTVIGANAQGYLDIS